MIKGRAPYPFETIAHAVSFSPALPALIAEMGRLCVLHNSLAIFIHVGKKTAEKHRELALHLSNNGFHDGNSRIYWEQGEVVANVLRICKYEVVDLLLAGVSERADLGLPAGSIARQLAKKAKCSVLILSGLPAGRFTKIVVNGKENKKTGLTIRTATYLANVEKLSEVVVAGELKLSQENAGDYMTISSLSESVSSADSMAPVIVRTVSPESENFKSLSDYAFQIQADLLVTYSSDHPFLIFDRLSDSNGIDELLNRMPSSLLIVHSRISG